MTGTHSLADLTSEQIGRLDRDRTVLIQPIGAVEQHGAHLPVITDSLIAERLTEEALALLPDDGEFWSLPVLPYGKSNEHLGFPGTISLSAATLTSVTMELGRSLASSGFRKLALVNGHGGQPGVLETAARDMRVESGLEVYPITLGRLGVPDEVTLGDADFDIHGGEHETAVMLALAPHLVHMDRAVADGHAVREIYRGLRHLTLEGLVPTAWLTRDVSDSGVIGDPTTATAETGALIVAHQARLLAEALVEIQGFSFGRAGS